MTGAGLAAVGDATWSSRILVQQPPMSQRLKCCRYRYLQMLESFGSVCCSIGKGLKRNPFVYLEMSSASADGD